MALGFSQEESQVVIIALSKNELHEVGTEMIQASQSVLPVVCDVSNEDRVETSVANILNMFHQIDMRRNNTASRAMRPDWGTPNQSLENNLAVNLFTRFLCQAYLATEVRYWWRFYHQCLFDVKMRRNP